MKIRKLIIPLIIVVGFLASAMTASANTSTVKVDCMLVVPPNPLTAAGLSTPYQLKGCNESNSLTTAFVQAAIITTAGQITVYPPLVINADSKAQVAPVVPVVPLGSTVGIWFGFNGNNLTLTGAGASSCVNGLSGSVFGQFAYCNAVAFFNAANAAIKSGTLVVPPLGTGADGKPCPTVRSFKVVDQDPSDNVQTQYLENTTSGAIIQDTAANRASYPNYVVISNPSDNRLLTAFIDPAIGCAGWSVPNQADPGSVVNALALDELQAAAFQAPPIAYVPLADPMTSFNGADSVAKTNLYRSGVDQPSVGSGSRTFGSLSFYCQNLANTFPNFMQLNKAKLMAAPSPVLAVGANLWLFLGGRFVATYEQLLSSSCQVATGKVDPVVVTYNASGAVISVTFR